MRKSLAVMFASFMVALGFMTVFSVLAAEPDIKLEKPLESFQVDLMEAFQNRHSTHEFINREISLRDLSTLLWAANGINRKSGQRTAPSAMGKYFIKLYVAANQGVYEYDPAANILKGIGPYNIKGKVGGQPDIATASHVLLMVADLRLLPDFMDRSTKLAMANGTAGTIAQNVYLAAAALKLGTRLVAGIKESNIRDELQLNMDEVPIFIMPLGYEK